MKGGKGEGEMLQHCGFLNSWLNYLPITVTQCTATKAARQTLQCDGINGAECGSNKAHPNYTHAHRGGVLTRCVSCSPDGR